MLCQSLHVTQKWKVFNRHARELQVRIAMDLEFAKLNRNEWEAFLSEFSELAKKYELILGQLDLAQTRMEGLREKTKQQVAKSGEALRQVSGAVNKLCDETEETLSEPERA